MDNHEAAREALYGDEPSPELDEHLAVCADCRRLQARLARIDEHIRSIPCPEPPEGLLERLLASTMPGVSSAATVTCWRPTGPEELELVRRSGWRAWPPRLPEQPFFYPVLNEEYAVQIARDWNAPRQGAGYVTRFRVDAAFAARYPVRQVGGREHVELWVPADELDAFNEHIVGVIEVVHEFGSGDMASTMRP